MADTTPATSTQARSTTRMTTDPRVNRAITYETHQRRAIEQDGTTHGARYAVDRQRFTLACAVYPMPAIERLEHQEFTDTEFWPVTCPGCKAAMAVVFTCPLCKTPGAEEFGFPIPNTDDSVDSARCINPACGIDWGLDPGANGGCTECGGSGHTGRGTIRDPLCACTDEANQTETVKTTEETAQ